MKVLIVTPVYHPSVGGAAICYQTLVEKLQDFEQIEHIYILTEYISKRKIIIKGNTLDINRFLMPRSACRHNWFYRFVSFVVTQIQLTLMILYFTYVKGVDVIHIHGTYCKVRARHDNIMLGTVFRLINCKIVVDVRDRLTIPRNDNLGDKIICVSKNIFSTILGNCSSPSRKVVQIPVPIKRTDPACFHQSSLDLSNCKPYLCFVGNVTEKKGIYELITAFKRLVAKSDTSLHLLIVGENMEGEVFLRQIRDCPAIEYLQARPQRDTQQIMAESELVILPSKSEGLPRVCLEAISLGKKVLCPPGVLEFEQHCPQFVIPEIEEEIILSKIKEILDKDEIPKYPLEHHDPHLVAKKTLELYSDLVKR